MIKNIQGLYEAFMDKDARFDGHFFVAISTTKIYCRPICKAKRPKEPNCTFYSTAAEAEKDGYRPCLLCRPELAPGNSIMDSSSKLAYRIAKLLEEHCGSEQSLSDFSKRLGYSDRHLRRVFLAEYNITPIQYLQTNRLLLAKSLLTDTGLSILDISMAAGFGSLRNFNNLFRKHYDLSPSNLRKKVNLKNKDRFITISMGYRPPYRWEGILNFLAYRAIVGAEIVRNNEYLRTIHIVTENNKHIYGWLKVAHAPKIHSLNITLCEELLPVLPQVLSKIRNLFDINSNPNMIFDALSSMNAIAPNLCTLGTRLPGCFDSFEMSVRAVLGQQISVKAASTLAKRLTMTFGSSIKTDIDGLTHVFPSPQDILNLNGRIEDNLGPLGITSLRANTIYELAKAFSLNKVNLNSYSNPETEIKKLMEIRGIGSWTAKYIAMRGMGWTDAFLESDVGIKKALKNNNQKCLIKMSESWKPWRSYATINLWNSLETNKKEV